MEKINIPDILPDNDIIYFNTLESKILSVDNKAKLSIRPCSEGYMMYVEPSLPQFRDELVRIIRKLHYLFGIKIEFSKSLLISKYITFKVKILEY